VPPLVVPKGFVSVNPVNAGVPAVDTSWLFFITVGIDLDCSIHEVPFETKTTVAVKFTVPTNVPLGVKFVPKVIVFPVVASLVIRNVIFLPAVPPVVALIDTLPVPCTVVVVKTSPRVVSQETGLA
jgi:hypothetical protein